jgi:hypothetical protein
MYDNDIASKLIVFFLLNSIFSGKIVGNLLINELTKPTNSSLLKRITNNELKKKELKIIKFKKY